MVVPLGLLQCIVTKCKCLKNIAKVIELCGMENDAPQTLGLYGVKPAA
jgi:hypothetical protein